jgi:hypothetical protein
MQYDVADDMEEVGLGADMIYVDEMNKLHVKK